MTDQEHYKKVKKDLLGKLVKCTNPSLQFGDDIGLVTKVEWVEHDIGAGIQIWSQWAAGWIDAGFGKGVVWHDWFRFSGNFEVIQ